MGFYFCGKYIYTDDDENEVERDMYAALPYFRILILMVTKVRKPT